MQNTAVDINPNLGGVSQEDSDDDYTETQRQTVSLFAQLGSEQTNEQETSDSESGEEWANDTERQLRSLENDFIDIVNSYLDKFSVSEDDEQTKFDTSAHCLQQETCKTNTIQALGMNVRGLNSNKTELENLFHNKRTNNVILFLSEIFEPATDAEIKGWKSYYLTRPKKKKQRRGGGSHYRPHKHKQ